MAATTTTYDDLMREVYAPGVTKQVINENPLLAQLGVDESATVQTSSSGGKYVVYHLQTGLNKSGALLAEGGEWNAPGNTINNRAVVNLTQLVSSGSVTDLLALETDSDRKAAESALTREMDGVKDAQSHLAGQAVWGGTDSCIPNAVVATGGVSGSGPWTLTLTSGQPIAATWLTVGLQISFATAPSSTTGLSTSKYSGAVVEITAVDEDTPSITVATVSGSPVPVATDHFVNLKSLNNGFQGLAQAISDTTSTFEGLDRSTEPTFVASNTHNAASGTASFAFNNYKAFRNKIRAKSGTSKADKSFLITSTGIVTSIYNELQDQVRFADPSTLYLGEAVKMPDGNVVNSHPQAKKGSIYSIFKDDCKVVGDPKGKWIEQGGSPFQRFARTTLTEFSYYQAFNLGWQRLNTSGELDRITDTTLY